MIQVFVFLLVSDASVRVYASVTNDQLSDFMASIWSSDVNAATGIKVNLQGHTSTGATSDQAPSSLFTYVNDYYYFHRPTYAALIRLLDNYNHVIGGAEHSTYEEDQEITAFLDEISKTSVMQKTLQFLHQHGYVGSTWRSLETELRRIWFGFYPRHGHVADSSGFEHVFVGEIDSKNVIGLHNWIQFRLQEQKGNVDYMGFIFSKQPNIVGIHFKWLSKVKPLGGFMYGTSPEFDIAMYTVCFFTRRNQKCDFSMNGHNVEVQTYDINHGGGIHLGTAYV